MSETNYGREKPCNVEVFWTVIHFSKAASDLSANWFTRQTKESLQCTTETNPGMVAKKPLLGVHETMSRMNIPNPHNRQVGQHAKWLRRMMEARRPQEGQRTESFDHMGEVRSLPIAEGVGLFATQAAFALGPEHNIFSHITRPRQCDPWVPGRCLIEGKMNAWWKTVGYLLSCGCICRVPDV